MQCVVDIGSDLAAKPLSKEDVERLRNTVEAETAGLLSTELLKGILEEMYDRLLGAEHFDDVIDHAALQIQRLAGLGMAREMLKVTDALSSLASEQEEEIRRRIRKLSALGQDR